VPKPIRDIRDNQILTSPQKHFLIEFTQSKIRNWFRLSGGTALSAFYLEHRFSEDLDFFSTDDIPLEPISEFIESIDFIRDIQYSKHVDRNLFSLKARLLTLPSGISGLTSKTVVEEMDILRFFSERVREIVEREIGAKDE
jgi:hypothetical protein